MADQTIGQRIFAIRRDLGDGWKTPLSQADFGAVLSKKSGRVYDSAMVSRMENGDRKVSLDEVDLIAGVDPKQRGREWLAWGEQPSAAADYIGGRHFTDGEIERARAARDAEPASTSVPAKTPARKAAGRKRG